MVGGGHWSWGEAGGMFNLNYAMEQVFDNNGCKKLTCKIIQKKVDLTVARAESRAFGWTVPYIGEFGWPLSHHKSSYRATRYPATEPLHIQLPNPTSHIQLTSHCISNYQTIHRISSYRATAYPTTKPYIPYHATKPLHIQLPSHHVSTYWATT